MPRSPFVFVFLALFALAMGPAYADPDPKEKKKKSLKEKLVKKLEDELIKQAKKYSRYNRNDRLASGSTSSRTTLGEGGSGDYSDILVKDNSGTYRHLDGRAATGSEIDQFKKKYPKKSFVPDFTIAKWKEGYTSDFDFNHRLYDSDRGNIDVRGLKLHASFDARTGKMTVKDKNGLTHEGLGLKASSIVSLTVIDVRGDIETVNFKKGDFSLKSRIAFALSAGPYMKATSTNMATLRGYYGNHTMEMGVRGNARLSLPTDVKYKGFKFTVTPYVGASAYSAATGSMDYEMDWHGSRRNNWNMGTRSGASFEAGVRVSVSFEDAEKLTRGLINKIKDGFR